MEVKLQELIEPFVINMQESNDFATQSPRFNKLCKDIINEFATLKSLELSNKDDDFNQGRDARAREVLLEITGA